MINNTNKAIYFIEVDLTLNRVVRVEIHSTFG